MSAFSNPASSTPDQVRDYVTSLLDTLGSREPIEVLRETPDALRSLIRGMSELQLSRPEKPGKWSVREVIQHLADSELVGSFRFRMALAQDRPPVPGYDQDAWAANLRYQESSVEDALGDFGRLRAANLRLFTRATPAELQRVVIHAERGEESLARLMQLYAAHDLVHRNQIVRIRGAVG